MFKTFFISLIVFFCMLLSVKADPYFDNSGNVVFSKEVSNSTRRQAKRNYIRKTNNTKKYKNNKNINHGGPDFTSETVKSSVNDGLVLFRGHRMPKSVSEKLIEVEKMFGKIEIISSCRPGAVIKKTNRPSMHRYCRAIDFNPKRGTYTAVANYLKRTWRGGVGTYSGYFNHIHIDNNRGRWHN